MHPGARRARAWAARTRHRRRRGLRGSQAASAAVRSFGSPARAVTAHFGAAGGGRQRLGWHLTSGGPTRGARRQTQHPVASGARRLP